MPDDKTDPREANEDQAKVADSTKAEPKTGEPDPNAQVGTDLDALLAENAEMRDRLLRTMADMENLRRRTEREKTDTARYAISNFARDVLTVGDNLKRTIEHVPADAAAEDPALKSFLEGVELTERELLNVLERHGVTRIEPLGQRFDPNCHQAMYEVEQRRCARGHGGRRHAVGLRDRRSLSQARAGRGVEGRRQDGQAEGRRQWHRSAQGRQRRFPGRRGGLRAGIASLRHSPQREIEAAAFGNKIGRWSRYCGK